MLMHVVMTNGHWSVRSVGEQREMTLVRMRFVMCDNGFPSVGSPGERYNSTTSNSMLWKSLEFSVVCCFDDCGNILNTSQGK